MVEYAELQVTSNFSFLRGASHPEELVATAATLECRAIAITDRNTLAGIVRAHAAAKKSGIKYIPATRLDTADGMSFLAYATDKAGYANLSGMLSKGNLRTEKGKCELYLADIYAACDGLLFIALPPDYERAGIESYTAFENRLRQVLPNLGGKVYLALLRCYTGQDSKNLARLNNMGMALGLPLVAVNDVHYHTAGRRQLHDVLTCVREKCTINDAGYRLHQNAERYLKAPAEMERIFRNYPEALANTVKIADACNFSLDELAYEYPEEITSEGRTPQEELEHYTWIGAGELFGERLSEKIKRDIEYELAFIARKNYAAYFLTVYDIVKFARSRRILCQGRGSAANSVVCYCLGITSVNPAKFKLLFARFMSDARDEPPDIDVDFEHERREEVMQYIYRKYGRNRAGIVATVTQVHWKGAVRDVGKAMGLSLDLVDKLAKNGYELTPEWLAGMPGHENGLNPNDLLLRKVIELTNTYIGFPRQLGQHTGGFVITRYNLSDLCPILNARMPNQTNIEWNKDDIEVLKFLKVDVLALGMLTCIRKAFDIAEHKYGRQFTLANIPQDDPQVYDMICAADTVGVFQIESRAQMSMLPRLKPRCFYDLVIEVAIVRPGPIQGDMVHPYLRRRNGEEPVEYPSTELEEILGRTLGVPLFQEQAMEIAIVAGGFSHEDADSLRRSMATFKAKGMVSALEEKLVSGMIGNGYTEEYARRVFRQLEGFGSYGFPESHAASFALLVYVSSWLKCHYPDVFAAALLNSLPMGFYQPAQIIIDAQKHGIQVLAVDVNYSVWDNALEVKNGRYYSLRLGFREVKGISENDVMLLSAGRTEKFTTIIDLVELGIQQATLQRLAEADAFRSMGKTRREALWEIAALADRPTGMFKGQPGNSSYEPEVQLPVMPLAEHVVQDYATTGLSLKAHPVHFVRGVLEARGVLQLGGLKRCRDKDYVRAAGLVLVRQRPGTASGVCFVTIEDETDFANLVIFKSVFDRYRKEIIGSKLLMVEGRLQRENDVIHIIVRRCYNYSQYLANMTQVNEQLQISRMRADENPAERDVQKHGVQLNMFSGGRNFR